MRLIFWTLLILNLGFFAFWQYQQRVIVDRQLSDVSEEVSLPNGVQRLELLEEFQRKNQRLESVRLLATDSSAGKEQDAMPVSRSVCTFVGAFPDQAQAEYFVKRLAVWGAKSAVKNVLVSSTVGYWLHLPPLSSRKELLRRLSELQRQGVDSYIIPDGDLENGISLGMFSERQRAEILKNRMSRLGYQPEIAEVPREKKELWVFLASEESIKIDADRWSELLSGKELLQKQQNLCSDVASL